MAKAIIDTEFISIIQTTENVINSEAMLILDKKDKEIFAKTWYLNNNLRRFKPSAYKYGLKMGNAPKYQPTTKICICHF